MDDFFKNNEFAQFIINDYFPDSDLSNEQKLQRVGDSIDEFTQVLEFFRLSSGQIRRH